MSSYPFVSTSNVFNPSDYTSAGGTLTLETADRRYLNIGGGVINGSLEISGSLTIGGQPVFSQAQADTRYLKLTGGTLTGGLTISRTASNSMISFLNGTASCSVYQFNNGDTYFGTTNSLSLHLQTNGTSRMEINGSGQIGISVAPNSSYRLNVNGSINIGSTSDYFINGQTFSSVLRTQFDARYVGIDLNGGEGIMNGARSFVNLTGSSETTFLTFRNPANTTNCVIGLSTTDCFIGTRTNTSLSLVSNNVSRILINTSGNVGIGVSPAYRLDVGGDVNITGTFRVNGTAISTSFTGGEVNGNITAIRPALSTTSLFTDYPLTARHGSSTDSTLTGIAFCCMTFAGTTPGASIMHRRVGSNSQGNLEFYTKSTTGGTDALTEWLRLTYNGRFGTNTAERFYGSRGRVDANTYSIFGICPSGGDGTWTSKIDYSHPTDVISCNTNINALAFTSNTLTTLSATVRSTATSGSSVLLDLGNNNSSSAQWRMAVNYNSGSPQNSSMDFYNTSSGWGISYANHGYGNSREGASMVLNPGPGGTGSYITAGLSTQLGTLHINGGTSTTLPACREFSSTANGVNQAGGTVSVSLYSYQNIWVRGALYSTSDKRVKKNIEGWDAGEAMNLLDENVKPVWYEWRDAGMGCKQLGYLAQDLYKADCKSLLQVFQNEDVKEDCDITGLKAGEQMVVDYSKINIYLVEICKQLNKRVIELEKTVDKLTSRPVVKKWLANKM
jgi:hypothetical protein